MYKSKKGGNSEREIVSTYEIFDLLNFQFEDQVFVKDIRIDQMCK